MSTVHLSRFVMGAVFMVLAATDTQAQNDSNWRFAGDAGTELRYFFRDPQWPGQADTPGLSAFFNAKARWRSDKDNQRASIAPFLRLDSQDSERSHFDLREAYWAFEGDGWELLAGANKVFWGVTESRHLVDIINQTDLVEDIDQEDKLGQPMVNLSFQRDWGLMDLFVMPIFRERTFPGIDGRLRTPLAVDTDNPLYESAAEDTHLDVALRWSHYFGDIDIGVSYFAGTGREPKLNLSDDGQSLIPFYHQIQQIGLDLQYTRDAWLWKLEGIARDGLDDQFPAVVGGVEYTLFGIRESAVDVGLLAEYLYDDRGPSEPVTVFDDDVFLGARIAWNDVNDTSVLAGVTVDTNESEYFLNLEAERRIGEDYFLEARLRIFQGNESLNQLSSFERDDYLQVSIQRFW